MPEKYINFEGGFVNKRTLILLGVACLIFVLAVPFMDHEGNERVASEKAAEQAQRDAKKAELSHRVAIQTDSRIALKNYLKDPDSAEIRNHNGNCGEVNSKNSFGGYSGFKRFIASPAIVAIEGENMDSDEFQKAWDQACK
ncbi:hypothetical protein NI401_09485 [Acinetobacter indicus]|uniref:hypothetical protein n=1 Tax=Acinetobacter indicus TaxID=756892 RepID=UPI00209B7136|nr:hypothetical protein [Acinetobacter indicus]MCO8103128.1 hypothetical protein [Acinetobacter indicus]